MKDATRKLWTEQDGRHPGDRLSLFAAVAEALPGTATVLYPGSYVDIAPSFVFDDVTYVDMDARAARFFTDDTGVDEIIAANRLSTAGATWRFVHQDYTEPLDLPAHSFDLLISLYAGFVSEHCSDHIRLGGHLLANPSHGDVAMASIDPRYRLAAVVEARDGRYRVGDDAMDSYLIPKRDVTLTKASLHELGRGIAYTKAPFAYVFERSA